MSGAEFSKLGAWEDRPRRNPSADLTTAQLDSRRAFLLTRLDGVASISDIVAISGMIERDALAALSALVEQDLVQIVPATGRRTPIAIEAAPMPVAVAEPVAPPEDDEEEDEPLSERPGEPAPVMERVDFLPDFHGVARDDVHWLRAKGDLGHVPGMPWQRLGTDRYGKFEFDRRALLRPCDLTVAQRREVLFLEANAGQLDHFEYFNMEPTADRTEWRRAYFRFSRQFHPDTFFRKNTGEFGGMVESIYRRGTRIHDAFSTDQELRDRYLRAVQARDAAYRGALEAARERYEQAKRDIEARREAQRVADRQRVAARRKSALRERLANNTRARREVHNPANERVERAQRFYEDGMQQYRDEKFIEAAASLQLAMTYDPRNEAYRQAYEKVSERAHAIKADQLWKFGYMQESVARIDEAIDSYLEAVKLSPRPSYCVHVAEMMLSMDRDLHRAAELARIASDADPRNVEYLLLLGKIYERVGLTVKAATVLERALKLAPKDERIKKAQKGLKR
ncbi:MAG: hypothetical protein KC549_07775 [Myxococcales bacterium]|nr:hypothetical protein [Myxococcales bacterium]